MIDPEVIRYTLFDLSGEGHGGSRRTAQISEILDDAGISWIKIPDGMDPPRLKLKYLGRLTRMIMLYLRVLVIIRKLPNTLKLFRTIWLTSQFTGIFEAVKGKSTHLLLWEMTKSEYAFIIPLFRKRGLRIVAIPHNIESLVPEQRSGITNRLSPYWKNEELRLLKKCDSIFSISEDDTSFLSRSGIDSDYLPYFPNRKNLEVLQKIRISRTKENFSTGGKRKILLLGSALNPPTRQGITSVLDIFNRRNIDFCELIIAGFGTDYFRDSDNGSNIRVLGELLPDQLSDVITSCSFALVHQSPTSGALTRIIELLIAGVPVIANPEAARSYIGIEGVFVYNDDDELLDLLKRRLPVPPIPQKPENEIRNFINKLIELK